LLRRWQHHYIEFGLSSTGHPTLAPGDSADFSFRMNGPNQATDIYTQSNDYSFDSSKTALSTWNHVVLVQNGTVVWGTPP
jgi:endoglucanase